MNSQDAKLRSHRHALVEAIDNYHNAVLMYTGMVDLHEHGTDAGEANWPEALAAITTTLTQDWDHLRRTLDDFVDAYGEGYLTHN